MAPSIPSESLRAISSRCARQRGPGLSGGSANATAQQNLRTKNLALAPSAGIAGPITLAGPVASRENSPHPTKEGTPLARRSLVDQLRLMLAHRPFHAAAGFLAAHLEVLHAVAALGDEVEDQGEVADEHDRRKDGDDAERRLLRVAADRF